MRRLAPHVEGAVRHLRREPQVLRAWMGQVIALESTLGSPAAKTYTQLIVVAVDADCAAHIAQDLALLLPDVFARLQPEQRARMVAVLKTVLHDTPEAATIVARHLPVLLDTLDDASLVDFVAQSVRLFSGTGRATASFLAMETRGARQVLATLSTHTALLDNHRTLSLYARAHCGVAVRVRPGNTRAFSDGKHIYLPTLVDTFGDDRDGLIYRILTARGAAYIEFGTLSLALDKVEGLWPTPQVDESDLARFFRGFDNPIVAKDLFAIFENARVEARMRTAYPGLSRQMDTLGDAWRPTVPDKAEGPPVAQAIAWLVATANGQTPPLPPDPAAAAAAQAAVLNVQKVRAAGADVHVSANAVVAAYPLLRALLQDAKATDVPLASMAADTGGLDLAGGWSPDGANDALGERLATELTTAHATFENPDTDGTSYAEMAEFLDRLQAPAGPVQGENTSPAGQQLSQARAEDCERVGVTRYPEWDFRVDDHKPDWVQLTEYKLTPANDGFVDRILDEHGALISSVRARFAALRPAAPERQPGRTDGDALDLERIIEARVARKAGVAGPEGLYRRTVSNRRDVAVAFLIDMSSSTNEVVNSTGQRVIDVEREALVLAAEAVDALGDACAIYGFSGYGRDDVAFYVAKDFSDPWDSKTRARVGRIAWKMENRDGAAIRHATAKLGQHPARIHLLILLSDGKPLDCGCDHYSDEYAQADARMALLEARQAGVHPFCITIDGAGRDYLRHIHGEHGYTIIDRVEQLPERLPAIYRRLTR